MNDEAQKVAAKIRESLKDYLNEKRFGTLLYSSIDTMRKGDIYILGLNPGGNSEDNKDTLDESIEALPNKTTNDYFENWGNRDDRAPFQLRLEKLIY